ncbi:putative ras GTPase-activating protein sar1 [Parasitella parasitica]|nr:putative ras GTPase-activating protein sar1 [Parasitella parasitica]
MIQDKNQSERNSGASYSAVGISSGGIVSRAVTAATANSLERRSTQSSLGRRASKQYSVSVFYSIATEQDVEIEDELANVQKTLRELKNNISTQSKNNFLLERDVRFLDSRIALLIQNRMALDETKHQSECTNQLEDHADISSDQFSGNHKFQHYGNLFFLLQSEPRYIASLCRLVNLSEIDTLLQTVMFTLYGNQYESREENLLLTMFQNVLAAQFEGATEFGSLLRANTPVSRMLTTYTRRGPGQTYLKAVLSKKINELIDQNDLNLQINPLKVYDEVIEEKCRLGTLPPGFMKSVTPEYAAENSDVQAIIRPRLEKLIEIANGFLSTIIESLESIPYGIRWICKQIRSLTKRKYPHATDSAISSLIGGFFFLRFINPAIVTPQAYMLIDSNPGPNPRTTLTLIAKMLQNIANKPTYAKESYMVPTNPFVETNKQRLQLFLDDICKVSDFYESLEMDQYMALSRKDISINITLNEMFSMHLLLDQHVQKLAPEPTHRLRILLQDLGPVPKQVPRNLNRLIQLPLYSRWETTPMMDGLLQRQPQQQKTKEEEEAEEQQQDTSIAFTSPENSITQNDIVYMETKSIFVQILRSLPHTQKLRTSNGVLFDLLRISEAAGSAKDPQLAIKGSKVRTMLKELEESGIVSRRNDYAFLVQEIKQELIHLGDLKDRVILEIKSLEQVFKTIQDHNDYLQSQLGTYKAYLQNVRMQSAGGPNDQRVLDSNNTSNTPALIRQNQQHPFSDTTNTAIKRNAAASTPVKSSNNKKKPTGPFKFTHQQLEKDGVIVESEVPESRKANIFLMIQSPITGTFIISLHYKGREKPILEIDLKLDDLLEKQKEKIKYLDLEYVKLSISKILQLLNKSFKGRSSRLGFF